MTAAHDTRIALVTRALILAVLLPVAAWSGEAEHEKVFRDYANELRNLGVQPLSAAWYGGERDGPIVTLLARGGPDQWSQYVAVGIKAAHAYPAKEYRLAQYWGKMAVALAAPTTVGGRDAINALLRRKDVPSRAVGWLLLALIEHRKYGVSLSWIDQQAVFDWCDEALGASVFIETLHGTVAEPLPAQLAPGPNLPRMRRVAIDIDSRRLAAWAIEEMLGIDSAIPRDASMIGLPAHDLAWNAAIDQAIARLPLTRSHVELRRCAAQLIDGRMQVRMGAEQARSLIQCYMLGQRADAASFAALLLWASRLSEAGDPAGLIAADEIVRFVHLTAKSGGYLHRGPFIEVGAAGPPPADRLSRLDPPPAASRGVAALQSWAVTVIEMHERDAASVPGPVAIGEWNRAANELGCRPQK